MRRIEKALEGELPVQKAFREWIRLRQGRLRPIEKKYAKSIAKTTGLSLRQVLRSKPFKRFQKALE